MTKERNNKLLFRLPYGVNIKYNVNFVPYKYVVYSPLSHMLYYKESHALAGRWAAFNDGTITKHRDMYILEKKK